MANLLTRVISMRKLKSWANICVSICASGRSEGSWQGRMLSSSQTAVDVHTQLLFTVLLALWAASREAFDPLTVVNGVQLDAVSQHKSSTVFGQQSSSSSSSSPALTVAIFCLWKKVWRSMPYTERDRAECACARQTSLAAYLDTSQQLIFLIDFIASFGASLG